MIEQLLFLFYYLCVEFMIDFSNLFGISYRDSNIIILFGILPLILTIDAAIFLVIVRRSMKFDRSQLA